MLPDDLPPLTVKSCIVRWSRDHDFGVQFLDPQEEDCARLARFVGAIQSGLLHFMNSERASTRTIPSRVRNADVMTATLIQQYGHGSLAVEAYEVDTL